MGGVWTQPLKLVDGVWFCVDGQWLGPATRFTSGWGYSRLRYPDVGDLRISRIDFAPDRRRGAQQVEIADGTWRDGQWVDFNPESEPIPFQTSA